MTYTTLKKISVTTAAIGLMTAGMISASLADREKIIIKPRNTNNEITTEDKQLKKTLPNDVTINGQRFQKVCGNGTVRSEAACGWRG